MAEGRRVSDLYEREDWKGKKGVELGMEGNRRETQVGPENE